MSRASAIDSFKQLGRVTQKTKRKYYSKKKKKKTKEVGKVKV